MTIFEFLVLHKLYSENDKGYTNGKGCGCLLAIIAFACFLVWLSENKGFLIVLGIAVVGTIIVITLREYLRYKKEPPEERKRREERRKKSNELTEWSRRNKC